jgi:hypothetical protein
LYLLTEEKFLPRLLASVQNGRYLTNVSIGLKISCIAGYDPWWRCSETPNLAAQLERELAEEMKVLGCSIIVGAGGHSGNIVFGRIDPRAQCCWEAWLC